MHILITLPWSGRVLLWLGMGRCIITENSWLTSPLPPKRLNDREVRVGWYDRKNVALQSESEGSTLSLITEGVQASRLWFHHYPMMTTPNTSGHCRHILAAWAIWAPEAPHILAALCQLWLIQQSIWLPLCLRQRMRKLVKYFRTS